MLVLTGSDPFVHAQKDFLPPEVSGFVLGMDMSSLLDRIGKSGMYSQMSVPKSKRTQLIWFPANDPHYKKVEFWISEKNRVYMARFGLREDSRADAATLKKQFLDKYVGSWLDPKRFRMDPNDMIVYLPKDSDKAPFFEVTNVQTGDRYFELFDQRIDAEDSPQPDENDGKRTNSPSSGSGVSQSPGVVSSPPAKQKTP